MNTEITHRTALAADLDGTLAESKMPITPAMATAVAGWLKTHPLAVISGGEYSRFEKQIVEQLPDGANLSNLYLFPTNGATCFVFKDGSWEQPYANTLTEEEKEHIFSAFKKAIQESEIAFEAVHGEQIEFRGGQVTFSALGQQAPLSEKAPWDPDQEKRKKIVALLAPLLPDYMITIGGATSIDVTKKGIDKEFALRKYFELLSIDEKDVIFLGDAIFPGGNDYAATRTGAECIKVSGPDETRSIILSLSEKAS